MARLAAPLVAMVVLLLAACGGSDAGSSAAAPGELVELTSVDELRSAFEADEGKARLLLVLSPT